MKLNFSRYLNYMTYTFPYYVDTEQLDKFYKGILCLQLIV